jgi:hypothetical protein
VGVEHDAEAFRSPDVDAHAHGRSP